MMTSMQNKTLSEWLSYIESTSSQTNRADLTHLKIIAERLNIWPISVPVITVTGTNGKGSCVALLTAILRNSAYKVGTYTSPHLLHYQERICCNNKPATDDQLCNAFDLIEQQRAEFVLNYFEWSTLAALIIFKQTQLDVWILEVGIGGRLDPVNIIDADLAIISTVAIDHINWLGTSPEEIGFEKSGIMRANKPVICGDFQTPDSVKKYANHISAKLLCQNESFAYTVNDNEWSWWNNNNKIYNHLPLPQLDIQNAATVLAAVEYLSPYFHLTEQAICDALINTSLPGRFQKISDAITTILDVAHNPSAAELLAKKLKLEQAKGRIIAVFAMLNDKDHFGTVNPLLSVIDEWHVASLNMPRGTKATHIAQILMSAGASVVYTYDDVQNAYLNAMSEAKPGDIVVIFGSFYTVAEVLRQLP